MTGDAVLVEAPGTAPGSDPLITCAFMSIVRANPDRSNIGAAILARKGGGPVNQN